MLLNDSTHHLAGAPPMRPQRKGMLSRRTRRPGRTRPLRLLRRRNRAKPLTDRWRLETTTKVIELRSLAAITREATRRHYREDGELWLRISDQLEVAQRAADARDRRPWVKKAFWPMDAVALESTLGNIDAVETSLLRMASRDQLIGRLPTVRAKVNRYLPSNDPRRMRLDKISRASKKDHFGLTQDKREAVVSAYHAAASQRRRDLVRAGSFFGVLAAAAVVLAAIALAVGIIGAVAPGKLPMCFHAESNGSYAVVCPTATTPATKQGAPEERPAGDLDDGIRATAGGADVAIVELVGLLAAALAAAAALRGLRGTSTPYRIPLALAALKLPAGAVTAVAGLLLMQGGFVPGLSALDTRAQIIAWALIFGYSQQLLTRLIDRQAHGVLTEVGGRGSDGARPSAIAERR